MLILNPKCFCLYTLGRKTKPMYSDHIKLKYLFSLQTIPTYRTRGSLVSPCKKAADNLKLKKNLHIATPTQLSKQGKQHN